MNSSEEIKAVHDMIHRQLPPECFVVIEHTLRNYSDESIEDWRCQVYSSDKSPLEHLFSCSGCLTVEKLAVEASKVIATSVNIPTKEAKIAALEKQIAKLRGE